MINDNSNPENRLLILYILNKANIPVTISNLTDIYFSINEINYFYFQQFLSDLKDKEFINIFEENNKHYYIITEKGKSTLTDLMYLIPSVMSVAADNAIQKIIKGLKYELSITTDFIILDANKINVKCNIDEGSSRLFSLEIYAGTMEQARKIAENWKNNSLKYYPQIINLLTNDDDSIDI
ncbi:MAG: DUF4364 family protein [Clostridiales bacterium]|nr:DUF4364 family protein [Clostridiales bacterium]